MDSIKIEANATGLKARLGNLMKGFMSFPMCVWKQNSKKVLHYADIGQIMACVKLSKSLHHNCL